MSDNTKFLTLPAFEEASEKVKEVTLETKLVQSDFFSKISPREWGKYAWRRNMAADRIPDGRRRRRSRKRIVMRTGRQTTEKYECI